MMCVIDNHDINVIETIGKLNSIIGKKVICRFYRFGKVCERRGVLNGFDFFSSVEINCAKIPFVSQLQSISKILLEETEEVLYFNPHISDEYADDDILSNYDNKDTFIKRIRKIFH